MKKLQEVLKKEKYKKLNFKVSKTQHLLIKVKINGVTGNFILDTGASNSCVGFEGIDYFNLTAGKSKTKASGAGATGTFAVVFAAVAFAVAGLLLKIPMIILST